MLSFDASCVNISNIENIYDMNPKMPLNTGSDGAVIRKSISSKLLKAPTKLNL